MRAGRGVYLSAEDNSMIEQDDCNSRLWRSNSGKMNLPYATTLKFAAVKMLAFVTTTTCTPPAVLPLES